MVGSVQLTPISTTAVLHQFPVAALYERRSSGKAVIDRRYNGWTRMNMDLAGDLRSGEFRRDARQAVPPKPGRCRYNRGATGLLGAAHALAPVTLSFRL